MRKRRRKFKRDSVIAVLAVFLVFQTALIIYLLKIKIAAPKLVEKAKVAIVIDDWGYNLKNVNFLKEFDYPITISTLPFLSYSTEVAEVAKDNNLEVILHLPLESHVAVNVEKNVILTTMSKQKAEQILNNALKNVPYCKGISNHMGSKATENTELMKIIFNNLKKRKLYFLDSYVTKRSVCSQLAKKMKIKFAQRTTFLDNDNRPYLIKEKLKSLFYDALKNGEAIGIGHDRSTTLEVINDFVSELDKEKFELVFISELAK